MIDAQLNGFDTTVMVVIFLSSILAFFRGFVKEVLSLGAWVGAGIITLYAFPTVTAMLEPHVKSKMMAAGLATLGTYLVALLVISVINSIILKYVKEGAEVGLLDKFLGLLFGFARGAFIISLGYLLLSMTLPKDKDKYPVWIKTAKSRELVEEGAMVLLKIAPNHLSQMTTIVENARKQHEEQQTEQGDNKDAGYSDKTKSDFERIMESIRSDKEPKSEEKGAGTTP